MGVPRTKRNWALWRARMLTDHNFKTIGARYGIGSARARQIFEKCCRRMRAALRQPGDIDLFREIPEEFAEAVRGMEIIFDLNGDIYTLTRKGQRRYIHDTCRFSDKRRHMRDRELKRLQCIAATSTGDAQRISNEESTDHAPRSIYPFSDHPVHGPGGSGRPSPVTATIEKGVPPMPKIKLNAKSFRQYLATHGTSTASDMAEYFGCSTSHIHHVGRQLRKNGYVEVEKFPAISKLYDGSEFVSHRIFGYRLPTPSKTTQPIDSKLTIEKAYASGELPAPTPPPALTPPATADAIIAAMRSLPANELALLAELGITPPPPKDWAEEFFYDMLTVMLGSKDLADKYRREKTHAKVGMWQDTVNFVRERAQPIEKTDD